MNEYLYSKIDEIPVSDFEKLIYDGEKLTYLV